MARSLGGTIAGMLLFGSPALADSADRCTHESWSVDGAPLTATICVPPGTAPHVTIGETFARNGQSFTRSLDVDTVSGSTVTRTIDNVPLSDVGSSKQLHLTIVVRPGEARIEHALLLPGALVLK